VQADVRRYIREKTNQACTVLWEVRGLTRSIAAKALNKSSDGMGIRCDERLPVGARVFIESQNLSRKGYAMVRHCTESESGYLIGLELLQQAQQRSEAAPAEVSNYYELLQISSNAERSTIERVYRFLATRYHPDNPQTGDPEHFIAITRAYEVLSDAERRAEYDAAVKAQTPAPSPIFESVDFMDGVDGEVNRRVAVLALLYFKCRTNPDNPRVSLADLEAKMGFPREYLDFTTWYLRAKKYITREDNSDFALTALGVDYVEENYTKSPILHQLLGSGADSSWKASNNANHTAGNKTRQLGAAQTISRPNDRPEADDNNRSQSAG